MYNVHLSLTTLQLYSDHEKQLARNLQLAKDLCGAVFENKDDVSKVRFLLEQGANPNHELYWRLEWFRKLPPLHWACSVGNLENVKILVEHGANINAGDGS